jgi:hypothetical protein
LKELTKVVTLGELFSNFLKLNKNKNGGKYFLKFIITIFFHVSLVFSGGKKNEKKKERKETTLDMGLRKNQATNSHIKVKNRVIRNQTNSHMLLATGRQPKLGVQVKIRNWCALFQKANQWIVVHVVHK